METHGLHVGIPAEAYHASDYVSPSRAKSALVSALQYKYDCDHPSEPTREMDFGTLAHAMFLEPDSLPIKFAVWTGGRRFGNVWNQFEQANADKNILTAAEYRTAIKVRDALHNHPAVAQLVKDDGYREVVVRWQDKATGLECRGRIDYYRQCDLVDLKTIQSVTDRAIVSNCLRYNYPMSMAAYHSGLQHLGFDSEPSLIFVSSKPPHDVNVKVVEADELEFGYRKWRKALSVIAKARETNHYPGISDEIKPLILPASAMEDGEEIELDWEETCQQ
jgi:exodeoxyribonuclease VIII